MAEMHASSLLHSKCTIMLSAINANVLTSVAESSMKVYEVPLYVYRCDLISRPLVAKACNKSKQNALRHDTSKRAGESKQFKSSAEGELQDLRLVSYEGG